MRRVKTALERIAEQVMLANLRIRVEYPSVEEACLGALVELKTARHALTREIKRIEKAVPPKKKRK